MLLNFSNISFLHPFHAEHCKLSCKKPSAVIDLFYIVYDLHRIQNMRINTK
jgi:hypothetical protein